MDLTIVFQSSIPRRSVALHAWESRGETWDVLASSEPATQFRFRLKGPVADQRSVKFKFRFPEERHWEDDIYIRTIPTRRAGTFWAFDYSSRVMSLDPDSQSAPREVTLRLLTRARFAGGLVYVWQPGQDVSARVPETSRDTAEGISSFRVPMEGWMQRGFHFKFIEPNGAFESDACNRVWRPADGDAVVVKSGQATLWTGATLTKRANIGLLFPTRLGGAPELKVVDQSGDHSEQIVAARSAPVPLPSDPRLSKAEYSVSVFPDAVYTLCTRDLSLEPEVARPLHIAVGDEGDVLDKLAILGDERWLSAVPAQADVGLVFHPRSWTPALSRLSFELRIGDGPVFDIVSATRAADGSWRATSRAPVGVGLQATPVADQPLDARADGAVGTRRAFALQDAAAVELHTVDAQPGFLARPATSQGSTLTGVVS